MLNTDVFLQCLTESGNIASEAQILHKWKRDMLAEGHRKAAEDIENTTLSLQGTSYAARMMIEGAWGVAFHWIAYGCTTKHVQHQDHHSRLASYLRRQGEMAVAEWWENLDHTRQGGWYGNNSDPDAAQYALDLLEKIHLWALS